MAKSARPPLFPHRMVAKDRGAHGGRGPIFAFSGRGYRAGAALAAGSRLTHSETDKPSAFQIIRDSASNRTYRRILASLPIDVAERYGYTPENGAEKLEAEAKAAMAAQDWKVLATIAEELAELNA